MPALNDYRIFISHAWRYGDDYERLIKLLNEARYFSYYNYSAPRERPLFPCGTPYTSNDIARKITDKIRPTQATIVISGIYGAHSDWMKYEIDESVRMRKPIIGIYPFGQVMAPTYVTTYADEMVRWNTTSIVEAIRKYAR